MIIFTTSLSQGHFSDFEIINSAFYVILIIQFVQKKQTKIMQSKILNHFWWCIAFSCKKSAILQAQRWGFSNDIIFFKFFNWVKIQSVPEKISPFNYNQIYNLIFIKTDIILSFSLLWKCHLSLWHQIITWILFWYVKNLMTFTFLNKYKMVFSKKIKAQYKIY